MSELKRTEHTNTKRKHVHILRLRLGQICSDRDASDRSEYWCVVRQTNAWASERAV